MYKLRLTRREKKKLLQLRWLVIFLALVAIGLVVWLVWVRPVQRGSGVKSFAECAAAGHPIQESYPEVCLTPDGKRFVNPEQDDAHQAALDDDQELVPPTNPALLRLDIDEWGITVPLTMETFDLAYAYIDMNGEQYLLFTYKRLVRLGVCKGDIGLRLNRTTLKREPPYSAANPEHLTQIGTHYLYATVPEVTKPCYDDKNAEQAALIKSIAGEQSLTQATTTLLSKVILMPKE